MYKSIVINNVEISYVKQCNKLKVTYARCNVSNKFIKHSKALVMLKCYLEDGNKQIVTYVKYGTGDKQGCYTINIDGV